MLETFLLFMLTGASLQLAGAGEPAEEPRKLKYRGPVVYSNLPPPVLYFPSFPPDPKISSRGDGEDKNIEYVPYPYENLPLLVYQSGNQPPVHVVEKSRDSAQATLPKDNNVQQQSGPAAPEMPEYLKNNQQQYQNTQPQDQKSSNTYSAGPQLFPDIENQQYVSIGISTYNTELPNNVLYNVPQPATPPSPPQKQNGVSYQVQNSMRPNAQQPSYTVAQNNAQQQSSYTVTQNNAQQQSSYTVAQNNAQQQPSYTVSQNNAQKGQQPLIIYDNPQLNQYVSNVAVQSQGQNLPYGQPQSNFQRIPDQKRQPQNQYAQRPQPAAIGYSVQENYGPKQMPASIQQLLNQQKGGDKENSYQYSSASMSPNSQGSSNYNMQQQGAVQDQPQVQKLQVQVQATNENIPDDDPEQQFLSIALYPYDIRGNNYKEEAKQFYKIVIPPQDGQNTQENAYGSQTLNPMEIQGQSFQYMKIGNNGQLVQPGSKQRNYPSNPNSMEIQKQQGMVMEKPRAMIIQQQIEMQRQYAMKMQRQHAMDIQKYREVEMQKQKAMNMQRQRATEMQKQKVMGMQRQQMMEKQKQQMMEKQKQQMMEKQKQMMGKQRQQMSQSQGQNFKSSNLGYQAEMNPDKSNMQKSNTKQEGPEKSPETEDDAIEYQQILIHIPHALAAQPQIVVQKGDIEQAINPYTGTAQVASVKNETDKLLNAVVSHIRQQPSYSGANKQQTITLQNSESYRGPVNSNFLKQAEYIKLPTENPAVTELIRHHYSYLRPSPKPSFRSRHPGAYASSNYHFATTNPIFLNSPSFQKNNFRSAPSYSFVEPPTLLQSSSQQYHNLFSTYPDELLAEASFQSPSYIPLVKPGQNAMSVLNAPQLQTNFPGPIKINAGPSSYGPMPHQMIYGNRYIPPPSSVSAGSGKYGNFIKKLTTLSNIVLSQSLGMKYQITPREETKEADEYNVEEVDESTLRDDNVQEGSKEKSGDTDKASVPQQKLSKRISKPTEDIPRPPIIVYKGPKPPVEVYGTKDDIEKGKGSLKKATSKQTGSKTDKNEEVDFVKTMYSILPKFVKRSITNRNDEDESVLVESELEEGNPLKEGTLIDELEAFVDSGDETDKKEFTSESRDSVQSTNSNKEPISAVNEDIEGLMKLLHKEEKSDIYSS